MCTAPRPRHAIYLQALSMLTCLDAKLRCFQGSTRPASILVGKAYFQRPSNRAVCSVLRVSRFFSDLFRSCGSQGHRQCVCVCGS